MENVENFKDTKLREGPSIESTQELLKFVKSQVISKNSTESCLKDEMDNLEKHENWRQRKPLPSIAGSKDSSQLSSFSQSCPEYGTNSHFELPWDVDSFQNRKPCRTRSLDVRPQSDACSQTQRLTRGFTLPPLNSESI